MKEQEEIKYINKHKMQARQFDPNAVVVSARRARAAVERAFIEGVNAGVDGARKINWTTIKIEENEEE